MAQEWETWIAVLKRFLEWSQAKGVNALGIVGFDEMIRLAATLLEAHPEVKRAERGRLRALLVDEFQDTDPEQLRLITGLLGKEHSDDHEILGFFVGDTKREYLPVSGCGCRLTICLRTSPPDEGVSSDPESDSDLDFSEPPSIAAVVNRCFPPSSGCSAMTGKAPADRTDQADPPEWVLD
jgi:hypothetical protein